MVITELGPRKTREKFLELIYICCSDEDDRRRFFNSCRSRYLAGSVWPSPKARANKISPVINRKSAFTYSGEGLKFWLDPPNDEEAPRTLPRLEPASEALEATWMDSGTDETFSEGVTWSYVYGTEIISTMPVWEKRSNTAHLQSYLIHPADFSVYRKEVTELRKQECVILTSYLSYPEVWRRLKNHPRREALIKGLETVYEGDGVTSGAAGSIIMGYAPTGPNTFRANYLAGSRGPYDAVRSPLQLYRWRDLYYYDDALCAWALVTMSGDQIVWDRPIEKIGVGPIPPFTKICPRPLPDYFWGLSEVEQLSPLQDWFTYRMDQSDRFLAKMLRPARALIGGGEMMEEKLAILDRPGGNAAFATQNAQIQEFKTEFPEAAFELLQIIGDFFTDQSGLRPSLFGKQEPGVRTEGMAASTMRMSAAEVRREALRIERNISDHADLVFELMRIYDDDYLLDAGGNQFYLAELPPNIRVHVDGHSHSPVFVEDHAQLAMALRKYGDITPEKFIELLQPAMKGALLWDVRKTQLVKMLAQEVVKIQQQQKRSGGASPT